MDRPTWYSTDLDDGWERVKAAFSNDWEQTKHDFGSKTATDLDQNVGDTLKQATGVTGATNASTKFTDHESAFRFGYAAQQNHKAKHPTWNNDLDTQLRTDYGSDYDRDRDDIRRAYDRKY